LTIINLLAEQTFSGSYTNSPYSRARPVLVIAPRTITSQLPGLPAIILLTAPD
jgi:hypothetical protein